VKFKHAVEQTPEIKDAFRNGLQALRRRDKRHVAPQDPQRLTGSVDVDAAVNDLYQNDPRWDYAVGQRHTNLDEEMVYWIEIHPANDRAVDDVLAKLEWLKMWLEDKAPKLNAMRREFIWVSSGTTSFTLTSPQQKRFALLGLQHKGRVFRIPDEAPV
jgi:hypothetical protein